VEERAVFALAGVSAAVGPPGRAAAGRLVWLLCTVAGGFLAAFVVRLNLLPPQKLTGLVMFVPLLVAAADSMALQSVGAVLLVLGGRKATATGLRRLALELATAVLLAAVCGAGAAGALLAVGWSVRMGACVGGAVAGSLAGAAGIGVVLSALLSHPRAGARVAAGPVARALAGSGALLIYFSLARWLLG
jgi:magnesium transporter